MNMVDIVMSRQLDSSRSLRHIDMFCQLRGLSLVDKSNRQCLNCMWHMIYGTGRKLERLELFGNILACIHTCRRRDWHQHYMRYTSLDHLYIVGKSYRKPFGDIVQLQERSHPYKLYIDHDEVQYKRSK